MIWRIFCLVLLFGALAALPGEAEWFGIERFATSGGGPPTEAVFDNSGTPWPFFNVVAAENYDTGGQGVAFSVWQNPGCGAAAGLYRADSVNFFTPSAGGLAFRVGCMKVGDFLKTTVNFSGAGPYTISLVASAAEDGGAWAVSLDNNPIATLPVASTGSTSTFRTVTTPSFSATANTNHIVKLQVASAGVSGFGPDLASFQGAQVGSVPSMAAIAGFTQLIINDNFQTLGAPSNWLDCAGAGSPLWWFGWVGFGTVDGHCFDITQATDPVGGQLAARIHFQDSYWTNTNSVAAGTMMETTNSSGVGRRIPPGFYSEIVARTDVLTSNGGGSMDLWGLTTTNGDYEIDGLEEAGLVSGISSNIHNAPTGFNNCARCASCPTAAVGGCSFDLTQYHTYAMRQTSGGTDRIFCAYIDGALQGCQTIQPNASQLTGLPMVIQAGSYKSGGSNPIGGTGKNTWIKSAKVWSCAGVNSGAQCNSGSNNP